MSKLFNPQRASGNAIFGPQDAGYSRRSGYARWLLQRLGIVGVVGGGGGGGDALWTAMATAAGVVFAKRFESSGDIPALLQPVAQTSFALADGTEGNVSIDSGLAPPGAAASLKFAVLNSHDSSSGSVSCYFGGTRTFSPGDTAWFSYLVYAPAEFAYAQWSLGDGPAHKLSIFSAGPNPGSASISSNQPNEVVNQSNNNRGILTGYQQDGLGHFNPIETSLVTSLSGSDITRQPSIDHGANPLTGTAPGGSAWSTDEQSRARYAALYSAESLEPFSRGLGDPLDGAFRQTPNVWIRITRRIVIGTAGVANSRDTMWAAIQGNPYTLLHDKTNIKLGSGPAYDTLWLLPYTTDRSPGGRKVSATSGTIGGVTALLCSVGNALGDGVLEYVASTGLFRYHSVNDGFGAAHGFSHANGIDLINLRGDKHGFATTTTGSNTLPVSSLVLADASAFPSSGTVVIGTPDTTNVGASHGAGEQRIEYTGKSTNTLTGCTGGAGTHDSGSRVQIASALVLRLDNAASLPVSGTTTMTVTVANGRPDTAIHYGDVIVSTAAIKTRDGYSPPSGIPAWVPAAGTIATVGTANLAGTTVEAALDVATNPFFSTNTSFWNNPIATSCAYNNAIFAPLLGTDGALLTMPAGHRESNDNSVYGYDCATGTHFALTKPYGSIQVPFRNGVTTWQSLLQSPDTYADSSAHGSNYSDAVRAEYFADTSRTTTLSDQPSCSQTYDNMLYLPPGYAGVGAKGGVLTMGRVARPPSNGWGGSQCHILDIAAAVANNAVGWTRIGASYDPIQGGPGSACLSLSRRKAYMVASGIGSSANHLITLDLDAGTVTTPTMSGGALSGYAYVEEGTNIRYSEARDIAFMWGYVSGFKLQVIDLDTRVIYNPGFSGTSPPAITGGYGPGGGEWVEADQAYYYWPGDTASYVYKLVMPVGDPRSNAWTWTRITLTGTTPIGQQTGLSHNGRFRWNAAAQCFLWWPAYTQHVQAMRLP